MIVFLEVERFRHEHLGGAEPVEGLAWPGIELPGDGVQFVLGEAGQIGALREVLAQQATGVLVDTALPVDCRPFRNTAPRSLVL